MIVKVGRMVLALALCGIAAYLVVSFVTMPYEVVTVPAAPSTSVRSEPSGFGTLILAVVFGLLALVAAFSGDWA